MKILPWFLLIVGLSTSPMANSSQSSISVERRWKSNWDLYEIQLDIGSGRSNIIEDLLSEIAMCVINFICENKI